jgi:hypothetical protein
MKIIRKKMNFKIIVVVLLSIIVFLGCSSSSKMVSNPKANNIVIDGKHDDWSGKLKYFEEKRAAVGFQNDNENLYFCLVTSDKANAMKIMALGLTVWFEQINDEQKIGLQYPKRIDKAVPKNIMGKNRSQNENTDFETSVKTMMQNQGEFSLVDEKSRIIYASPIGSNDGYEIKAGAVSQQFVYEAKIPIGNNNLAQMPINIFPDEKINIKFETGEIDLDEMKKNAGMQSDMDLTSERTRGAGQGGRQGGAHGGRPSSSRMGLERFTLDVEVGLAK